MRICIQSGTPLGTSDIYRPYYESLVRHAKRVARPDTVCEFPNLEEDPDRGRAFVRAPALKTAVDI